MTVSLLPSPPAPLHDSIYRFRANTYQPAADAVLSQHAQAMEQLKTELATLEVQRAQQLREVQALADRQAQVAQSLPQLQARTYFIEVQQRNRELYDLLVKEQQMEVEAAALAAEIRHLPDGEAKRQHVETLRSRLDTMFEIKQENRRREIRQLEHELNGLYKRLNEREALRDRIIAQRLNELIGVQSSVDR